MSTPMYEVVALRPAAAAPTAEALPLAAQRWLVLDQPPAASADFSITEVTGKWRAIKVTRSVLASTVDVEELLAGRTCARTVLFDCPAVVQKLGADYSVLVERSYEHAFGVAARQASEL